MGLIASMPMDDWPERHAEIDIGWAASIPTRLHRSAWRRRHQHRGVDGYACSGLVRDPRDAISVGSSLISPSYIETQGRFYEAGSA